MTINKSDVIEMEQKLNRWEYEYRVLDRPTVSDQYYDEQMNLYKKMIEEHPEYKTEDSPLNKIGTVLTDGFKKEKHNFIMGSLENTYSFEELEKWIDSVISEFGKVKFSVEDKFDGISLSLRFKDGKLFKAITRGNGCLDYDSVIETDKGELKIGEIVEKHIDCKVKSFDFKNNKIIWNDVKNYFINDNDEKWYCLTLEDGRKLKITGNHQVYVKNLNKFKKVEDLTENDDFYVI